MIDETVLDNPVWHALTEKHYNQAINYGNVKFYQPDYAPFGAFNNQADTTEAIKKHSKIIKTFFIVGNKPKMPIGFNPPIKYVGLQMMLRNKIQHPITNNIVELNEKHFPDLLNLMALAYPEYFKQKTSALGRYFGIYKNQKLVAVTGERMQTNYFTEISAVVTHPEHTGNGYAKELLTHTSNKIFKENKTPFLHVDITNLGPINLYKKLGFVTRRQLEFWKISR
ncbi:GNAT family N-acetyltransferase [Algibacter sp. PT7-4]|uniref:GNAT family N-acetyltransferase n=1 Tax=Algibacter ulvanivorans TaxID=3400999 RepID=UPI003AAEEBCB